MTAYVLNDQFVALAVVDDYISFIWTERYDKYGDFELYMPIGAATVQYLQPDYYLYLLESEKLMIIEDVTISSDPEDGATVTVTGRSLESILDRRIIWGSTCFEEGSLQNAIQTLLTNNVISPAIADRKIGNFIFEASTDDYITGLTVKETSYFGEGLYETIQELCEKNGIGFKIIPDENLNFVFKLYIGIDHSYDQSTNPYVIFSPSFDNLANSRYVETKSSYKTAAIVAGPQEITGIEGIDDETLKELGIDTSENAYRPLVDCKMTNDTGLHRREIFLDADDIATGDGYRAYDDLVIYRTMWERGYAELLKNSITQALDGEAEFNDTFTYGVDFSLGDIVQVENEYGINTTARISEVVWTKNINGETVIPTFTTASDMEEFEEDEIDTPDVIKELQGE